MPIIDHEALIKPTPEQIIWRYLDLDKFESILMDKGLFFCRSDKFSDPFEGTIPKRESEYRIITERRMAQFHKREMTHEEAVKKSEEMGNLHKRFRRAFIVNCWHINQGESDAMWRLYLKTNEGVVIQTTVNKLRESFDNSEEEIYISKVRYLDYEKKIWFHENDYPIRNYNLFTPIVHKRTAFAHENELRIFQQINEAVHNEKYWDDKSNYMGNLISCNIEHLIEKVIIPPTADEQIKNKVEEILKKHGLNREIEKSKLNEEPYY